MTLGPGASRETHSIRRILRAAGRIAADRRRKSTVQTKQISNRGHLQQITTVTGDYGSYFHFCRVMSEPSKHQGCRVVSGAASLLPLVKGSQAPRAQDAPPASLLVKPFLKRMALFWVHSV